VFDLLQEVLALGRKYIQRYLRFFIKLKRWHVFTFLTHETLHIPDDAERFGCGAGHVSAYPFESALAVFPKVNYCFFFIKYEIKHSVHLLLPYSSTDA
jgi:hypothetical protein